jgi:hypothetical protein
MSSIAISFLVFLGASCSALLGMFVSSKLPVQHQSSESKDVVRLVMGLVATTVAVALGLLISSAKNFYDMQNNAVTQVAANYILLDQILAYYGPETSDTRSALRNGLAHLLEHDLSLRRSDQPFLDVESGARLGGSFLTKILELSQKDENQRSLKAQALSVAFQLGETRWLFFGQNAIPVPSLLLAMLVGWLILLFLSFGIFAPRNLTVLIGLLVPALAVSGAIFLIAEMYRPEGGLIRISDAPFRAALSQLSR